MLPVRGGVVLTPKRHGDVKSIEIRDGVIALNGDPATGSELREKLGDDAELVLQVSYLSGGDAGALGPALRRGAACELAGARARRTRSGAGSRATQSSGAVRRVERRSPLAPPSQRVARPRRRRDYGR